MTKTQKNNSKARRLNTFLSHSAQFFTIGTKNASFCIGLCECLFLCLVILITRSSKLRQQKETQTRFFRMNMEAQVYRLSQNGQQRFLVVSRCVALKENCDNMWIFIFGGVVKRCLIHTVKKPSSESKQCKFKSASKFIFVQWMRTFFFYEFFDGDRGSESFDSSWSSLRQRENYEEKWTEGAKTWRC